MVSLAQGQQRGGRNIGRTVGRYSLLSRIAAGGMGEVYLAQLKSMQGVERLFAIKLLLPQLAEQQEIVDMFITEARIASQMTHPNICQVFELGLEGDELFICMEYLEGVPLTTILGAHNPMRPLPPQMSVSIIQQAAAGLQYAHDLTDNAGNSLGVVHRDISPSNLFLTSSGVVKVLDFGIVKANTSQHKTRTGMLKGKFGYMAPEHIKAMPLDGRADVFSLGIVLFEMLTNRPLFNHRSEYDAIQEITERPLPSLIAMRPDLPQILEDVAHKALSRDLDERYRTMKEFNRALGRASEELFGTPVNSDFFSDYVKENYPDELAKSRQLIETSTGTLDENTPCEAPTVAPPSRQAPPRIQTSNTGLPTGAVIGLVALSLGMVALALVMFLKKDAPTTGIVFDGTLVSDQDARTREAILPRDDQAILGDATEATPLSPTPQPQPQPQPPTDRCAKKTGAEAKNRCYVSKKGGGFLTCLERHSDAESAVELHLSFDLAKSGAIEGITISPPGLPPKLSSCMKKVARGVKFGRQKTSVRFGIPVKANRR